MMKAMLFLLCLLGLCSQQLAAHTPNYYEGSELTVFAHSGLRLRMEPNLHSHTLRIIPYGERVCVESTFGWPDSLADRISWNEGYWIEVSYMGAYGYVFDGFLSSFNLPDHEKQLCLECVSLAVPMREYVLGNFKILSTENRGGEELMESISEFEGGIFMRQSSNGSWLHIEFQFRENSISEVLNLLRSQLVGNDQRNYFEENLLFKVGSAGKVNEVVFRSGDNELRLEERSDGSVSLNSSVPCNPAGC